MQVLKEEVKEKVHNAAVAEFRAKGFQKASMRSIAGKAGMTVGNLYRYYRNKNDLFYSVVNPAYDKIVKLINEKRKPELTEGVEYRMLMENIANSIIDIHKKHKNELFILFEGSKGTKYEKAKEKIITMTEEQIRKYVIEEINAYRPAPRDAFIARVIAVSFIEGMMTVLKKYDCGEEIRENILLFQDFFFKDLGKRL